MLYNIIGYILNKWILKLIKKIKIDRETKNLFIEAIKQQSKFTIHIPGRNIEYVIIDKFVIMASMTVDWNSWNGNGRAQTIWRNFTERPSLAWIWSASENGSIQIASGLLEPGGQGGNWPPTFAKISPKFLQNMGFCLKFLLLAPPLWTLPPHL